MKLFITYNSNDQLLADGLTQPAEKLQAWGRILRGMEKKREHSDTSVFWRYFSSLDATQQTTPNLALLPANKGFLNSAPETFTLYKPIEKCRKGWATMGSFDPESVAGTKNNFYYQSDNFSLYSLFNKEELREQLTEVSRALVLIEEEMASTQNLARLIGEHLDNYSLTHEEAHLWKAAELFEALKTSARQQLNAYVHDLCRLKKKRLPPGKWDKRNHYRRMIRFLFKNMEADEDSNALCIQSRKPALLHLQLPIHEQKTDFRSVGYTLSRYRAFGRGKKRD